MWHKEVDLDEWQGGYMFFPEEEMRCKGNEKRLCACGGMLPKHSFMLTLVELRKAVGPLSVTSGARCPKYNSVVSGTGFTGPHTEGRAADIKCSHEHTLKIIEEALKLPFTGFGLDQKGGGRYIHLDMVVRPSRYIWTY